MREHSAKSAESEYVRILWAFTFTDNFMAKYTENLVQAHAVDTRPSLRIIEGLGTRLPQPARVPTLTVTFNVDDHFQLEMIVNIHVIILERVLADSI